MSISGFGGDPDGGYNRCCRAPFRRVKAMPMAPQVATGLENGELMNDAMVKKVLINGQLFILRGEKIYDAKGQLVK